MVCCCPFRTLLYIVLVYIAIVYFALPHPRLKPHSYIYPEPPQFLGPLTKNYYLDGAERLFENVIGSGPESIEIRDGVLYTGLEDGRIVAIKDKEIKTVVQVGGKSCIPQGSPSDEKSCGRPLGLRFDTEGNLMVADCAKGVYKVNVKTAKNGDIYASDASSKWDYRIFEKAFVEGAPDGRLLHYNAQTKKLTTLLDNLYFPNGVQLTEKEDALLFSQSTRYQIMKFHLKGPKAGQLEVLIDNLPGVPDNIRPSGRGTFWVALYTARLPNQQSFNERISRCTFTKRMVYTSMSLVLSVTGWVQWTLPMPIFDVIHELTEQFIESTLLPTTYGIVLEINEDGEILRSLHSPRAVINKISQVTENQGTLYIGSPFNPFIGKISLPT